MLYPIAASSASIRSILDGRLANLVLGLITPPVAISLTIGALIARVPAREVTREVVPFFITALAVLAW